MEYYLLTLAVVLTGGLVGFGLYRAYSFESRLANRLDLVVRASHTCASKMTAACDQLDAMQLDGKKSFDYQKKLSEHQRVLLASLNRQIQQLDSHFTAEKAVAGQGQGAKAIAAFREGSERFSQPETSGDGKAGNGVVRLEDMFRRIEASGEAGPSLIKKSNPRSSSGSLPLTHIAAAERRRVVNG